MNYNVGFRFHPNDEQLINYFLIPKVLGLASEVDMPIAEVNVLQHEPWDLPEFSIIQSNEPYWYFFYRLDCKSLNSKRVGRRTKTGYWKATGSDRQVRTRDTKQLIGSKKTLVFHLGRVSEKVRDQGTNWVIHEYHVAPDVPNPSAYVICCLKRKVNGKASTSIPVEGESMQRTQYLSEKEHALFVALNINQVI